MTGSPWRRSWRADPAARVIADRHYNRQAIGAAQFVPPGRCLVLLTADRSALWVTSWPIAEYVQHAWGGAWVNSLFRNEGGHLSSDLIRRAVAHTRAEWPDAPALGIVSFIDAGKTRRKRDPGRCYRRAGWSHAGFTAGGLYALQQLPGEHARPGSYSRFAGTPIRPGGVMTGQVPAEALTFAQDPDGTFPHIAGTGLPEAVSSLLPATDGCYSITHVPGASEVTIRWSFPGTGRSRLRARPALAQAGRALTEAGYWARSAAADPADGLVVAMREERPCVAAWEGQHGRRCRHPADFSVSTGGCPERFSCGDHLHRVIRQMGRDLGAGEFTVRFTETGGGGAACPRT